MKEEIELKFEIDQDSIASIVADLQTKACVYLGAEFHDDYVPDFPDFLMKTKKELIRFRYVQTCGASFWLTTYKKKISTAEYQHYQELEADSRSETYVEDLRTVEEKINQYTTKNTLGSIHLSSDVDASHDNIRAADLSEIRIHSQKIRHVFQHARGQVTVDIFPESIGSFMEIEAESKVDIDVMCSALNLPVADKISEDYGEVIKSRHADRAYPHNRIALFDAKQLPALLKQYKLL